MSSTQTREGDEKIKMLREALKCVNGTLDFDKLAIKMGVPNGEAMRKRFKRFFEKDEEPIHIKGSTLGNNEESAIIPKTPRTPKPKAVKLTTNGDDSAATPKSKSVRKRKVVEVLKDNEEASNDVAEKEVFTKDSTPVSDDDAASKSPKKKARKAPAKPRKPAEPRTPKATKCPGTAKTPKTPPISKPPRTPNAPLSTHKPYSAEEMVMHLAASGNDDLTDFKEDEDAKTDTSMIGSPAISAKTDVLIKVTEEASGGVMGEPAKQAKRDAVESAMKGKIDI